MPTALLGRGEVDARALSILHVTAPFTLADCTVAHAAAYGLTGEIHSSTRADHGRTRAWAAAFHRASFGGVRYFVRHDPSQSSIGIDFRRAETAAGAAI